MGASLKEAKSALNSVGYSLDTINHPPIYARLEAISNGWNEAKDIDDTNVFLITMIISILLTTRIE